MRKDVLKLINSRFKDKPPRCFTSIIIKRLKCKPSISNFPRNRLSSSQQQVLNVPVELTFLLFDKKFGRLEPVQTPLSLTEV